MAGTILYSGEMFQEMIDKLDQTITELGNVREAVSQGIVSLNVKAGAGKEIAINDTVLSNTAGAWADLCTIKSLAAGTVRLSGTFRASGGRASYNYSGYLGYSLDGTNWTTIKSLGQNGTFDLNSAFSVDIPVKINDIIHIAAYCTAATYVTSALQAGAKLGYDLVDIVNDGAFIRAT